MFKKQITVNIEDLDSKIGVLTKELEEIEDEEEYEIAVSKIDSLVELRTKLAKSKADGRVSVKPVVISGLFGLASVLVVLKYEERDVITSKAFNMATSMFRGSK